MDKRVSFVFLIMGYTHLAISQVNADLIERFPEATFSVDNKFCVSYSHEEQVDFGAIYITTKSEGELIDVFGKNENFERDSSLLLERSFVEQHLLPDTFQGIPIREYLDAEFYALNLLKSTSKFYAIAYERIFVAGLRSSEKFLCTISKQGKFISRIKIASFVHSGSGISSSGGRVPWFPLEQGCIERNLNIHFKSPVNGEKNYRIQEDGGIVEMK